MNETVPVVLDGERLDRFVALVTGRPRAEVAALVAGGAVRVGGQPVTTRSRRVAAGDVVEADVPDRFVPGIEADASISVPVVYDDDQVVVVDKPAALVVHPGSGKQTATMVNGLLAHYPEIAMVGDPTRPGVVHRLDKGTSGLLVVARTPVAYAALVAQLASRTVERVYRALVWGHVEAPAGLVDAPIGRSRDDRTRMAVASDGREARTRYAVVRRFDDPPTTLLECRLETGRTHQIRVHLAAIGHAVVGDGRYRGERRALTVARPFLHATTLAFDHPVAGQRMRFDSPLPDDLQEVLGGLD